MEKNQSRLFEEVHIYLKFDLAYWDNSTPIAVDFWDAIRLYNNPSFRNRNVLHTTLTHFLSFSYGKRLFVHTPDRKVHEITLGECEGTDKDIRVAHNIEKLLIAGEFDWFNRHMY